MEMIMDVDPGAVIFPNPKILISCPPMRQVMRGRAPGTSITQYILDSVDDLAHGVSSMTSTRLFGWQQRLKNLPLRIRQIARISWSVSRHDSCSSAMKADHSTTFVDNFRQHCLLNSLYSGFHMCIQCKYRFIFASSQISSNMDWDGSYASGG